MLSVQVSVWVETGFETFKSDTYPDPIKNRVHVGFWSGYVGLDNSGYRVTFTTGTYFTILGDPYQLHIIIQY